MWLPTSAPCNAANPFVRSPVVWRVGGFLCRLTRRFFSRLVLLDDAHAAAFRGTALGAPLAFPSSYIAGVTADHLHEFRAAQFTGSNVVVAGQGWSRDVEVVWCLMRCRGRGPWDTI